MRAPQTYINERASSKLGGEAAEIMAREFQPFLVELYDSIKDKQPGDEFILTCSFIRAEQIKATEQEPEPSNVVAFPVKLN